MSRVKRNCGREYRAGQDKAILTKWENKELGTKNARKQVENVNDIKFESDRAFVDWANSLGYFQEKVEVKLDDTGRIAQIYHDDELWLDREQFA